jgi:hypothetical protein
MKARNTFGEGEEVEEGQQQQEEQQQQHKVEGAMLRKDSAAVTQLQSSSTQPPPLVRLAVAGSQLAFIQRGATQYLEHHFHAAWTSEAARASGEWTSERMPSTRSSSMRSSSMRSSSSRSDAGADDGHDGVVQMNWWRWYVLSALLAMNLHHSWLYNVLVGEATSHHGQTWYYKYTRLSCLVPSWYQQLVNEGSRHADVMFSNKDIGRLESHVKLLRKLKVEVEALGVLEAKAIEERIGKEEEGEEEEKDTELKAKAELQLGRQRQFTNLHIGFRRHTAWLRRVKGRRSIRQRVDAARDKQRQGLVDEALLETMPEEKRKRLLTEKALVQEAGNWSTSGTKAWLKGVVFGALMMEQKPTEVEASLLEYVAISVCWLYIVFLSYFCLMSVVVMPQDEALVVILTWVGAFSINQILLSPLTLCITNVILPMLLVTYFVKPWLDSRKRKTKARWGALKFAAHHHSPGSSPVTSHDPSPDAGPGQGDSVAPLKARLRMAVQKEKGLGQAHS